MIVQAIKKMTTKIVNSSVEWENEYKPAVGVNDVDRERHFTNLNEALLKKVRQAKNEEI